MSERYGTCKSCQGKGYKDRYDSILLKTERICCGMCNGEGFSGDAIEKLERDLWTEREQETFPVEDGWRGLV